MKRLLFLLIGWLLAVSSPVARADLSFDYFYETLSPHGSWVQTVDYGYCWQPQTMPESWAPYTDGHWVYTDAGWTWVSNEPFGAITYHYGRWVRLQGVGWIWQPGYEWAPAWVSWRWSDDVVGWAPLPPEVAFDDEIGISSGVDYHYDIGPDYYSFCRVSDFGAPILTSVIYPRSYNTTIIYNTVNVTNITVVNRGRRIVCNYGPDYERISRHSHRKIDRLRLDWYKEPPRRGHVQRAHREGGVLRVSAPSFRRPEKGTLRNVRVDRRLEQVKVDRGWASTKEVKDRERIRAKMERDAQNAGRASDRYADRSKGHQERQKAPSTPERAPTRQTQQERAYSEAKEAIRQQQERRRLEEQRSRQQADQRRPLEPWQQPTTNRDERPDQRAQNEQRQRQQAEAARRQREATADRERASQRQQQEAAARRHQEEAARQQQQRSQAEAARRQQSEEMSRRQREMDRRQADQRQSDQRRQQQDMARRQQEQAQRRQVDQQRQETERRRYEQERIVQQRNQEQRRRETQMQDRVRERVDQRRRDYEDQRRRRD